MRLTLRPNVECETPLACDALPVLQDSKSPIERRLLETAASYRCPPSARAKTVAALQLAPLLRSQPGRPTDRGLRPRDRGAAPHARSLAESFLQRYAKSVLAARVRST